MSLADLADHLGPQRCLGCARRGPVACADCRAALIPGACERRVPGVGGIAAAWDYDGLARSLVLGLKLRGQRGAAVELGQAIAERVWQQGTRAEAIAWIPGRAADISRRGFDHAELIARAVSNELGLPRLRALRRAANPVDQTALGAGARRSNLRGAFVATRSLDTVAVVDDLVTTGATLAEAARALMAAGARYIEGFVACSVQ